MTAAKRDTLLVLLRSRAVRIIGGIYVLIGVWDPISSQFHLPTLGELLGLGVVYLPGWVWASAVQLLLFYGLFDYVRTRLDAGNVIRGAKAASAKPEPVPPDMPLREVLERIAAIKGGKISSLDVNHELADKAKLHKLTVWARVGDRPIEKLAKWQIDICTFDVETGEILIPSSYSSVHYTHIQFVRTEIDQVWPEPSNKML